jgi:hypothetical protein
LDFSGPQRVTFVLFAFVFVILDFSSSHGTYLALTPSALRVYQRDPSTAHLKRTATDRATVL